MCDKGEDTILYYPTIQIEDGVWLRNAILYWDKVSSIVPGFNYSQTNSIEVEYLRNAGLYVPIFPAEMCGYEEIYREFCKVVKKNLGEHRKASNRNNRQMQIHMDKMNISNKKLVHIEKTPNDIIDYLLDEGIARKNCDGPWIDMNELDANIYMATLARYLAKIHKNVEIGTDKSRKFLYPYNRIRSKSVIDKQIYLNIAIQEALPVPNLNIPLDYLIDFKRQHREQLRCFKKRVDEFQWSLRKCENFEEFQERINDFQNEIARDLQEIDEVMNSNGIRKAKKALKILVPLGMELGGSILESRGIISAMEAKMANVAANLGVHFFCTEKEPQIDENKAYLFYGRKNGIM